MRVGISKVIAMRSKIVRGHLVIFSALWLNLCNSSDQTLTCFSNISLKFNVLKYIIKSVTGDAMTENFIRNSEHKSKP